MVVAAWIASLIALLCWAPVNAQQTFRLANIYADEMVLQMAPKSAHIWGFGEPGSQVTITFGSQDFSGTTAADGKWSVRLAPQPAGGPYLLNLEYLPLTGPSESGSLTVYFGDVWVCSGQSNMEMKLKEIFNATEEIEKAATYDNIRILQLTRTTSDFELDELNGTTMAWGKIDVGTVGEFSASCLLFGERLSERLGARPLGLLEASWPGTRIEAWSSARVTAACDTPPSSETNRNADNVLWNGMISPLTSLTVRGAIWFQGENNAGYNIDYYPCHIQRLTEDWKSSFVDGAVPVVVENGVAFPFGIFQLGPTSGGRDERWGQLRWHQSADLGTVPNQLLPEAFMSASYDLTDRGSPSGPVHPRDKQTTVSRLANAASALLYNYNYHMNGPVVESIVESSPGVLSLTYDSDILVQAASGFSYQLPDGSWVETSITGSSGRQVNVTSDPMATHLAYGWTVTVCEYKQCAIYGADDEALPAQIWLWDLSQINKA